MAEGIKSLVGRRIDRSVKFMGQDIKICKLTVSEVLQIQADAKNVKEDDDSGFEILKKVIRLSVVGASELSDEDFSTFPMDELTKLSQEVMKFSGMVAEQGK
jgi:hypothetical protein